MKILGKYKVREMVGEHVVVMPGRYGVDMTRIITLNASSLYLWEALQGRDFTVDQVAGLLCDRYEVDERTARQDAAAWVARLKENGIVEE